MSELGGTFSGRVVIDPTRLAAWLRSPDGPWIRELFRAADFVVDRGKARVGVDTGELRDSLVKRLLQGPLGPEVWVGSELDRAWWHHEGTPPRIIEPVNAKVLSFMWNGEQVFFKSVNHPGTPPNRFLAEAVKDLESRY